MSRKRKKRQKRGFPIAIILGFGESEHTFVSLWQLFSVQVKPFAPNILDLGRKMKSANDKQIYTYFERITQAFKPLLTQGNQSIILVSDLENDMHSQYLQHLQKHYRWMFHNPRYPIRFGQLSGRASTKAEVELLRERDDFQELLQKTQDAEQEGILRLFEREIQKETDDQPTLLVGLPEIEQYVYTANNVNQRRVEYLLVSEKYLQKTPSKNRVNRLMQILENRKIKVRVISKETSAFARVEQFGGLLCFLESQKSFHIRTKPIE